MSRFSVRLVLPGLLVSALFGAMCLLSGCSGGAGGADGTGAVAMRITWPAATPAAAVMPAAIPSATQCIQITLSNGAWNRTITVVRPSGETTSDVSVPDVPVGTVHLHLGAYDGYTDPPPTATGNLLAWAVADVTVTLNNTTPAGVTMGTAPASVVVDAGEASTVINVIDALQLNATAYDGEGNILLITAITWSTSDEGIATADGNGLVSAHFPGLVTITATVQDVSGSLDVRVNGWELWDTAPGVGSYNTVVYNNKIYCFGPNTLSGPTAQWYVYTPATKNWQAAPDLPVTRHTPALGVIGGKIYLAENYNYAVNKTYEIDPTTLAVTEKALMPTGVHAPAATVFQNKLWLIGGQDGYGYPTSAVQVYDPATDSWAMKNNFPVGLWFGAAAVYAGNLTVCGTGSDSPVTTVYRYNATTDSWETAPAMNTARTRADLGLSSDRLYAIGGGVSAAYTGTTSVEFFNGSIWQPGPPVPEPIIAWNSGAQAAVGNYLYVIGGIHAYTDRQNVYRLWVGPGVSPSPGTH